MKYLFIIIFSLFAFTPTLLTQSNADMGVAAIGLVVSDIETSEAFYKDVLGMIEVGGFSLDEKWSEEAGAANGKPFSVKQFKLKDQPTATVLKLAYFDKTNRRPDSQGLNVLSGVNYITLYYTDKEFKKVMKRVDKAGIDKVGWVKRDTYQLVFIQDPDGIYVEIVGPPDE